MSIEAIPSLELIRELVKPGIKQEIKLSMIVELRRKANYVADSLNRASELLLESMER